MNIFFPPNQRQLQVCTILQVIRRKKQTKLGGMESNLLTGSTHVFGLVVSLYYLFSFGLALTFTFLSFFFLRSAYLPPSIRSFLLPRNEGRCFLVVL